MSTVIETGRGLIGEAAIAGVPLRALGGAAVAMRCPSASEPPLARHYGDIDFMGRARDRAAIIAVMEASGWAADTRFNAVNGHRRLLFSDGGEEHIDVFLDSFSMCHRLELTNRLELDSETIPLSDLLLTKLQIAELNHKDLQDIAAVLADHRVEGGDGIDPTRLSEILCADWGWWRTVSETLDLLSTRMSTLDLPPQAAARVTEGLAALGAILEEPKSRRWRMRAKVGERVPWREDPEEVER